MNSKRLKTCSVAVIIGLASVNTQAASIWLEPVTHGPIIGGVANLEIWADASDVGGFLAGGLDLFYDATIVTYNGDFTFDAAFATDPAFSRTGDNCSVTSSTGCAVPGEINGIAFGNFAGIAGGGPTLVGSLSFIGVSLGYTLLTMADNDLPAGAWFATDGSGPLTVDYGSAEMNMPDIPPPAAVWLMISGLGMLLAIARNRKIA
jgi:hypothetical protein